MKIDQITFCGYVPRPSGGSQGRNIASNISKYAPTNLFWCVEHLLSSWCSAGTRWTTSKMRKIGFPLYLTSATVRIVLDHLKIIFMVPRWHVSLANTLDWSDVIFCASLPYTTSSQRQNRWNNLKNAQNRWKSMKIDLITFCGYVPRPSGGSQGRNIASNISKYAPTNLFWWVKHFLSSWCSAGTRGKPSKIENAKNMATPPPTAPMWKTAMSYGLLGVPEAAVLPQTSPNMPPLTFFDV